MSLAGNHREGSPEGERKAKKQKTVYTITEFDSLHRQHDGKTLLENLRRYPMSEDPVGGDYYQESLLKMKLILRHQSEFPSKLQRAIYEALRKATLSMAEPAEIGITFIKFTRNAVANFVFGCFFRNGYRRSVVVHCNMDTNDEIELAIRLFPGVLTQYRQVNSSKPRNALFFLADRAEAVPFIPLFADLAVEFGASDQIDFRRLGNLLLAENYDERVTNSYEKSIPVVVDLHMKGLLQSIAPPLRIVIEAAANEKINLNELYTLIRFDPGNLMVGTSTTSTREVSIDQAEKPMNLLEELRKESVGSHIYNGIEYMKMDLILQHTSRFPSALQTEIATSKALAETDAVLFDHELEKRVLEFLVSEEFDSRVDSEDQIELIIRLFPSALKCEDLFIGERMSRLFIGEHDVFSWALYADALPFIPLYADLAVEFGAVDRSFFRNLAETLLLNCKNAAKLRFNEKDSMELHDKSMTALARLREKGHVTNDDIFTVVGKFFVQALQYSTNPTFILEKALPLLTQWRPTILVDTRAYDLFGQSHIGVFQFLKSARSEGKLDIRLYKLILELGMFYHPNVLLGCGFHGNNFSFACSCFGREKATQTMNDKILAHSNKRYHTNRNKLQSLVIEAATNKRNHTNRSKLQSLVIEAATNERISLDGLYTLIRFDPSELINSRPYLPQKCD